MLLARCAAAAARDEGVDAILIAGLFGGYPRMRERELACAAELVAIRASGVPVVVQSAFATSGCGPVELLRRAGVAVLSDVSRLANALAATVARAATAPRPATIARPAAAPRAATALRPAAAAESPMPAEQVAELLREQGIVLPPMTVARTPAELAAAAAAASYPACVKISDPAVTHKSDVGGVRLRLADASQLLAAGHDLWDRFPGAPLLVMPSLPGGPELLVGTGCDPVFGAYVLIGRGGIWAEADPDVTLRLAPSGEDTALRALLSLRCAATLTGGRGTRPVDLAALAELVAAMSRLGAEHPDLSVEINPVIAYPVGYAVADLRACRVARPDQAMAAEHGSSGAGKAAQ